MTVSTRSYILNLNTFITGLGIYFVIWRQLFSSSVLWYRFTGQKVLLSSYIFFKLHKRLHTKRIMRIGILIARIFYRNNSRLWLLDIIENWSKHQIDWLVPERRNSIANALAIELRFSCTNLSRWSIAGENNLSETSTKQTSQLGTSCNTWWLSNQAVKYLNGPKT